MKKLICARNIICDIYTNKQTKLLTYQHRAYCLALPYNRRGDISSKDNKVLPSPLAFS